MSSSWGSDTVHYASDRFDIDASFSKTVGGSAVVSCDLTGEIGTIDSNNETEALQFLHDFVTALEGAGFSVSIRRTDGSVSCMLTTS